MSTISRTDHAKELPNPALQSDEHDGRWLPLAFDAERQRVIPDEGLTPDDVLGPWSADEVVAWMWRDGRVPVWVDVNVFAEHSGGVIVELLCAGRFTANPARLYYECDGGRSPFGVKSPWLPPRWREGEWFDVGWHLDRDR